MERHHNENLLGLSDWLALSGLSTFATGEILDVVDEKYSRKIPKVGDLDDAAAARTSFSCAMLR